MKPELIWYVDRNWATNITLDEDGFVRILTNGDSVGFKREEMPDLFDALDEVKKELIKRYGPLVDGPK